MADHTGDFAAFLQRREQASTAFVNGEYGPLAALSAQHAPATLFGPRGDCLTGAENVNGANAAGAKRFTGAVENRFEVLHSDASGDLGYWVGVQRSLVRMEGQQEPVRFDLRVTEIFLREDGEWKLIHRHADKLAGQ